MDENMKVLEEADEYIDSAEPTIEDGISLLERLENACNVINKRIIEQRGKIKELGKIPNSQLLKEGNAEEEKIPTSR